MAERESLPSRAWVARETSERFNNLSDIGWSAYNWLLGQGGAIYLREDQAGPFVDLPWPYSPKEPLQGLFVPGSAFLGERRALLERDFWALAAL
jgi:hypothetical protein